MRYTNRWFATAILRSVWLPACVCVLACNGAAMSAQAQCAPWSPLAAGMAEGVNAVAVMPNNDVIIGGGNGLGSSAPMAHIARWDGISWSPLGSGIPGGVGALAVLPNGELIAGGLFSTAGGVAAANVARWDGSWHAMGAGLANGNVQALAVSPSGELYAAGVFSVNPNNQFDVAHWTGSTWEAVGSGFNGNAGYIYALAALPNGQLVAGGDFNGSVKLWNGTAWSVLGTFANGRVSALVGMPNGDIIAGGSFTMIQGTPARHLARWNGHAWSALDDGFVNGNTFSETVLSLKVLSNGDLLAGGLFESVNHAPANSIARWNGTGWFPLGGGVLAASTQNQVRAIGVLSTGAIIAGGVFDQAGSVAARNVASHVIGTNTCPADFDCSGGLAVADIFYFLNTWFSGNPYSDLNGNGVEVSDIFDFLTAWFAGC